MKITVYNIYTGEIVARRSVGRDELAVYQSGDIDCLLYDVEDSTNYVDISTKLEAKRPNMQISTSKTTVSANGIDTTTLINLPDPCIVTYTGPGFELTNEVTGGTAEFTTDVIGLHTIRVVAFPYLDWEGTFNAV